MGQRSKAEMLPDDVRAELDARLIDNRFSGYEALEKWLQGKGVSIGKSSIHRYAERTLADRIERLQRTNDMARAAVAAAPDDEGAVNSMLIRMTQEKLFEVVDVMEVDPATTDLPKLARAIADLGRATIATKKWSASLRDKLAAAEKKVNAEIGAGRLGNVPPEVLAGMLARIREIYTGAMVGPG